MPDDVLERLERVEVQHADYIRVLSSHTAANTGTLANVQQMLGQLLAEVAVVRQDVANIAGRLDRLDAFLRSKFNGGAS